MRISWIYRLPANPTIAKVKFYSMGVYLFIDTEHRKLARTSYSGGREH